MSRAASIVTALAAVLAMASCDDTDDDSMPIEAGVITDLATMDFASGFVGCPPWMMDDNRGLVWAESPRAVPATDPFTTPREQLGAEFGRSASTDRCPCQLLYLGYLPRDMTPLPDGFSSPNAGLVTITSGTTIDLVPDAFGRYPGKSPGVLWAAGDPVLFQAAGGTVPSFTVGLNAPHPVTMVSPSANAEAHLANEQGLVLTWTDGVAGEAVFVDVIIGGFELRNEARCLFDAAAGVGMIPRDILYGDSGYVSVASVTMRSIEQDGWTIEARAAVPARAPDGSDYKTTINLK